MPQEKKMARILPMTMHCIITSPLTPNLWKVNFVIRGNTYYRAVKSIMKIHHVVKIGGKMCHAVRNKNGAKFAYDNAYHNYLSADTKLVEGTLCHSGEHIYHGVQSVLLHTGCTPTLTRVFFLARNFSHYTPVFFWREIFLTRS